MVTNTKTLRGNQHKLDHNKDGKISSDDLKKVRNNGIAEKFLEKKKKDPCWKGYVQLGMKDKGGKKVPNCVPESAEELEEAIVSVKPGEFDKTGEHNHHLAVDIDNDGKLDLSVVVPDNHPTMDSAKNAEHHTKIKDSVAKACSKIHRKNMSNGYVHNYSVSQESEVDDVESDVERAYSDMQEGINSEESLEEKKLTPAELKKHEEIAMAIDRENPGIDISKKMAIATATAKRVAEEQIDDLKEESKPKHRINVSVVDPQSVFITHRGAQSGAYVNKDGLHSGVLQKFVRIPHDENDKDGAITKAKSFYKKKGYKVLDAIHVGMVKEETEEQIDESMPFNSTTSAYKGWAKAVKDKHRDSVAGMPLKFGPSLKNKTTGKRHSTIAYIGAHTVGWYDHTTGKSHVKDKHVYECAIKDNIMYTFLSGTNLLENIKEEKDPGYSDGVAVSADVKFDKFGRKYPAKRIKVEDTDDELAETSEPISTRDKSDTKLPNVKHGGKLQGEIPTGVKKPVKQTMFGDKDWLKHFGLKHGE